MDKTFAYHKPGPVSAVKIINLRESFSRLKTEIEGDAPQSRERAIALTKLEESAMWAIKAVVFNDPDSEADTAVEPRTAAGSSD